MESSFTEMTSGLLWSKSVKFDVFGHNLGKMTERNFCLNAERWREEEPTLELAMQGLPYTLTPKITPAQCTNFSLLQKSQVQLDRPLLYLVVVNEARGRQDNLAHDNIILYADPSIRFYGSHIRFFPEMITYAKKKSWRILHNIRRLRYVESVLEKML